MKMNPVMVRLLEPWTCAAIDLQGPSETLGRLPLFRGIQHSGSDSDPDSDGLPDGIRPCSAYCGILQGAGPWTDIPDATRLYCTPASGPYRFFRTCNQPQGWGSPPRAGGCSPTCSPLLSK